MSPTVPVIRPAATPERQLTGRAVLVMLVVFFGLVIVVNLVMVRAAISTFGGVDTPSSYQAGLVFKTEEAAAMAQNARDWKVDARLMPSSNGLVATIDMQDAGGHPVVGADIVARLAHPVDERRDVTLALSPFKAGEYRGEGKVPAGQWILDIEVTRDGQRLFRSRNRVVVP